MGSIDSPNLITVVLCDDHDLFRRGLAEMLSTADDIEVAGEANTHELALADGSISPFEHSESYENDGKGQP